MSLKGRISSPLEAGPSVLDGHHLPPHLTPALEHASSRLARKSLHLTLVVVRRDYHVPSVRIPSQASPSPGVYTPITPATPPSSSSSASSSFSKFGFATGPVTALKQLVRNSSRQAYESNPARRVELECNTTSSNTPMKSPGLESPGLRLRWPLSPTTPPLSPPPMTPCTPSSAATDCPGPMTLCGASWLRLLHAPELSARDQKIQRAVFTKTAQKFSLGSSLTPAVSPTAYGLSSQLFTNSLIQNEVLFSDGLTILSLDRLYSLKTALSSYSRTKSPLRLEDAVDELRRYILSSNGAKVTKSDLCRSYDWLNISPAAVSDLDRMYRRAYGGPTEVGAISGVKRAPPPSGKPPHRHKSRSYAAPPQTGEPSIRPDQDGFALELDIGDLSPSQIGLAVTTFETSKPPSPRGPALTLQTMFVSRPLVLRSKWDYDDDDDDDDGGGGGDGNGGDEDNDGDRTARPLDSTPVGFVSWTNSTSIDQVLGAGVASPDGSSVRDGPMTPNGYEDISPVTRGEWGFLMVDDAFRGERTVAVETC